MERAAPTRKPHSSTSDLLTCSETPTPLSPADSPGNAKPHSTTSDLLTCSHQPSDGINKVLSGGHISHEEAGSQNQRMESWHTLQFLERSGLEQGLLLASYNGNETSYKDYRNMLISHPSLKDKEGNCIVVVSDVQDVDGWGALHFAIEGNQLKMVKFLIHEMALPVDHADIDGNTPLHLAIAREDYDATVFLVDNGASVNHANKAGVTPIHLAASAQKDTVALIRLLLANGAQIDPIGRSGTPLHLAAMRGNLGAVRCLLENKAVANTTSPHGYTPLMMALLANSVDCVELLLKADAKPNQGDVRGTTPLMFASLSKNLEAVKLLLEYGADPTIRDLDNGYAISYAANVGWSDGEFLLFEKLVEQKKVSSQDYFSLSGMRFFREEAIEGQFETARSNYEKAFREHNFTEALHWCTMGLCLKPEDADSQYDRIACLLGLECHHEALTYAVAFTTLHRHYAHGFHILAKIYERLKQPKESTRAMERAAVLDPVHIPMARDMMERLMKGTREDVKFKGLF